MRPAAKLIRTASIALSLAVVVSQPAATQGERPPRVAGGVLTGSCSKPTAVDMAAAGSAGRSIALFHMTSTWLSSMGQKTLLLSFIDTREQSTEGADNPDMSRRLLVFIRSMRRQHSIDALAVALVDGSSGLTSDGGQPLVNFRFDQDLVDTPVLSGTAGIGVMRELGVRCLPTTFLINRQAQITARWEGLVLPSTLASAIAAQAGERPLVP